MISVSLSFNNFFLFFFFCGIKPNNLFFVIVKFCFLSFDLRILNSEIFLVITLLIFLILSLDLITKLSTILVITGFSIFLQFIKLKSVTFLFIVKSSDFFSLIF